MAYLPQTGSLRPPQPLSLPFATRVATQSAVARLFQALIRPLSPLDAEPFRAGKNVIRPDPAQALATIRDDWIGKQIAYHRANAATMGAMSRSLERIGKWLGRAVIGVVALDLVLLALGIFALSEGLSHFVQVAAPWLLFLAAILPAAVASLNGVRFQSECGRLADRSERMITVLTDLDRRAETWQAADPSIPPTGGTLRGSPVQVIDIIRLAEDVARIMLDEVADWSALYAKEMVEP